MSEDDRADNLENEKSAAPRVISPGNAVNVAFPFSNINVGRPSGDIAELADLVAELAAMVDAPNSDLRKRAQALAARFRK